MTKEIYFDGEIHHSSKQSTPFPKTDNPDALELIDEIRRNGGTDVTIYYGRIYGDKKRRWGDGFHFHTSYVISGPDENGIIKTRNSIYKIVS